MTLATRIAVLRDGRIERLGTPEEIYRRPATLLVAGFVGSPGMNLLPARREGGLLRFEGGATLALEGLVCGNVAGTDRVILGVRPENLLLGPPGGPDAPTARVETVDLTGPEKLVSLRHGTMRITAQVDPHAALHPGDETALRCAPGSGLLFDAQTRRLVV